MHVVEFLVLAAAVVVVASYVHVRRFPWKDCPQCGGNKRIKSGRTHRDCSKCGATGRVRRIGAGGERR